MKILLITIGGWNNRKSKTRMLQHFKFWEKEGKSVKMIGWHYADKKENKNVIENIINECGIYDIIYIYRSLIPPKIIKQIKNKCNKLVFDFDDAIYCVSSLQSSKDFDSYYKINERIKRIYRKIIRGNEFFSERKVYLDNTLKLCDGVIAGSTELANYSKKNCDKVIIAPTPVGLSKIINKEVNDKTIIGWYGNPEGYHYLNLLRNVFGKIGEIYKEKILLRIISEPPFPEFKNIKIENICYNNDKIYNLNEIFDIGIMPLSNDCWALGKCGYKLLNYMANGLPVIASHIGFNADIIKHNYNGLLAKNENEWIKQLCRLIDDYKLRKRLSVEGYNTVKLNYTFDVIHNRITDFLNDIVNENQKIS